MAFTVTALAEAQRRTEEQLQTLIRRVDAMDRRLGRVETDVGDMRGQLLETRYRDRVGAYFGRLLRRVRVVSARDLDDLLDAATAAGAIDDETAHELRLADLIVRGRRPADGQETYLAVEVSAGVGRDDVERAVQRATLLSKLGPALPVVAGLRINAKAEALAKGHGVWQMLDGRAIDPAAA